MATNAPIQGTATADIIKIGMKRVDDILKKEYSREDVRLVLQVHDELIYEIKKEKVEKISKMIKEAMEDVVPEEFTKGMKRVPLVVSTSFGKNWGNLK